MEKSSDCQNWIKLLRCACEHDVVYRIFFQITGWVLPVSLVCHLAQGVVVDNTGN